MEAKAAGFLLDHGCFVALAQCFMGSDILQLSVSLLPGGVVEEDEVCSVARLLGELCHLPFKMELVLSIKWLIFKMVREVIEQLTC